jgi:hypothetical protein
MSHEKPQAKQFEVNPNQIAKPSKKFEHSWQEIKKITANTQINLCASSVSE